MTPVAAKEVFMLRFLLALIWIALIAIPALAQKTNDTHQTAAAKAAVAEIGARNNALVEVKRLGKSKVKGSISEIREDDFDVISSDNRSLGVVITIRYDEVAKIKGKGVDWGNAAAKAGWVGLKAFKVMVIILSGVNLQLPP
jgi:hypothetical protein